MKSNLLILNDDKTEVIHFSSRHKTNTEKLTSLRVGGLDIVLNPYALDLSHQVRISIHRYADSAVLHAGAAYTFHDQA